MSFRPPRQQKSTLFYALIKEEVYPGVIEFSGVVPCSRFGISRAGSGRVLRPFHGALPIIAAIPAPSFRRSPPCPPGPPPDPRPLCVPHPEFVLWASSTLPAALAISSCNTPAF